jgi:class 3 adenylate cyclase
MGGGFDIDATWDDFFFAFRSDRFPGITARFTLPTDPTGAPRGQVGLMVRQGLTGDAACVALMARRGEILTARRAEEAAAMRPEGVPPPDRVRTASPEIWLRLLPGPDRLFGYGSVDGLEWHELGSWPFELSTDPAWGIALCANHAPFRGPLASWTTLVLGGAPLPAAARTDLRLFLPTLWVNLVTRLGFEIPIPSDLQRWVERRGGPFTGLYSQTIDHLRRRLMTAYDSPMNDVPRRWFITPILEEPDLLHPDDPIYRRASRSAGTLRYDPRREMAGRDIMRRLRGLLVLMVPPDQAPKALTMTQILRQWARRGALGVWSPTPPSPGQQVTNQFPRQAVTGGGPPRPWNTGLLAVATASELIFHRIPPGTLASESVWLARPKPPPTIPRVIGGLAALAWLAGGLWFLRYWRSGPERTFLPLSRQLLGGFLLAIFPTLVIAIAILDQSRAEHLTRQEGDSQETLFVRAAALEAATDLTRATTRALFRATFHPCVFASGVPQAGSEATNRLAETLPTLWRHLTLLGLPLLDLSVAPTQGQGAMFDPTRPVPATKDPRLLATRYLARTGARSLGWGEDQEPSSRPGAPDQEMLIGSELEKEYEDVGLTLGLDQVGRFFLAPDQLSTWSSSQGTNDHTYTTLIPGASRPPLGVMLTWRTMPEFHSFYYHLLQPRYDAPVRWSLIKSNAPAFRKARPVDSLRADPGQPFLTHEWLRLTPPADHRLALTAQRRRTAVLEERGHGSTRTLALAIPLRQLNDNIVIGTLRLGRILERVNREFLLQGALLVGILVLTIWLATLVTDRFLTPMHRLAAAAQRIAAGDYSPRLPLGDGGEFDALATAFNRMAEEAAQGRLLGRFVSEATLTTLREGRSAEARAGQSREAFVLFVTLTGFKDLLAERDPQSIVSLLNRALAAAGRHIRAAGGDIDKFIGDKLLAFFPITGTTPPAATLAQALHAAATLRQRLPVEIPDLPGPPALGLTRGPVLFGLLGTPSVRLEMTILGDTVNLASRLADLAARSGGGLVTDGAVADLVAATPDLAAAFPGRRLAETRVKGKRREVEIFRFDTA